VTFEDGPSGASRKPDGLRLLIKRTKSGSDKSLANFPDLGRLSRLHFCCGVRAARLKRRFSPSLPRSKVNESIRGTVTIHDGARCFYTSHRNAHALPIFIMTIHREWQWQKGESRRRAGSWRVLARIASCRCQSPAGRYGCSNNWTPLLAGLSSPRIDNRPRRT